MVRPGVLLVVAVAALACAAGRSSAQPPLPGVLAPPRPTFSPYLNLTNRNMDPAVSYYGIIRPQIAAAGAIRSLQQQVASSTQPMAGAQPAVDPGLPLTGQPTYFLNNGGYFLNSRTGGAPLVTTARTTRPLPLTPPAAPRAPQIR
jgi:hypothetical protein